MSRHTGPYDNDRLTEFKGLLVFHLEKSRMDVKFLFIMDFYGQTLIETMGEAKNLKK